MHFDFLFPVLYSQHDITIFGGIASVLRERGARVALLAHNREGFEQLRKEHDHVYYFYDGFDRSVTPSLEELRAIETRYGIPNVADFVRPEQLYWERPLEILLKRTAHAFRTLERFLDQHEVDVALAFPGAGITIRAIDRLAALGRLHFVRLDYAPFHGRVALSTMDGRWDDLPARLPDLSPSARTFTEELIGHATRQRKMFSPVAHIVPKAANVRWTIEHANLLFTDEQVDWSPAYQIANRARRMARRAVVWPLFRQPVRRPYVFFPLHVPHDTAVTVRAAPYRDQAAIVEYLATRALPTGTELFVKPHPAAFDEYSVRSLRRISKIPRVRLVHPAVNSHEMISGAIASVVLTSTVGYESLLYKKPVVVLGKVFYRGFGITHDVDDPSNLPATVARAVHAPPDPEAVLRFVHAAHEATYPGDFYDMSPESHAALAQAFLAKAARVRERAARPFEQRSV